MAEASERARLSREETAGWDEMTEVLDRIPASEMQTPGAGPGDWTVKEVLFHVGAWTDQAAGRLALIRTGRYVEEPIDTDARNVAYLAAGRGLDVHTVRVGLERARGRTLAGWAALRELSAPAVEWFGESGPEHYGEHVADLRAFAERIGAQGRPGAPARRAAILAAERECREDIDRRISAMPGEALVAPGVTPDGWSVKDTMWHVARWWEDFLDAVPRFADPGFDPDDDTEGEIDAMNRAWFEESRALGMDVVRERWASARDAGVRAFAELPDPSRTAERWFEECGTIHYEKHLIDLRAWTSGGSSLRVAGKGPP